MITRRAGAALGALLAAALVVVAIVQATNQADAGRAPGTRVVRVVDGDTVVIHLSGRDEHVRLIGIDTPETVDPRKPVQCFGKEASRRAAALLPSGTPVRLERDVEARDQYDRALGYLWVGSNQINWLMIRMGWAVMLTYPPNVQYVEHFRSAEQKARAEKRGLWAIDGFACLPVERRRGRC